jgi:serine phosphatase RsbU (regulator of sigma subunit)
VARLSNPSDGPPGTAPARRRGRGPLLRYGFAVAASAAATGLTLWLEDLLTPSLFPVYYTAVAITVWYAGLAPAVLATALCTVAAAYYFIPPTGTLVIGWPREAIQLGLFALASLLVAAIAAVVRASQGRAEAARTAADAAQERLAFLAEASTQLGSSLDYRTTLQNVARLAVPYIADWCVVDVLDQEGTPARVALAHTDPKLERWAGQFEIRRPGEEAGARGLSTVIRTGRSELFRVVTDEMLGRGARDESELTALRALGLSSVMIVPLQIRGRALGAITFAMAESGRHFDEADLTLAEDLARRAAIAIDNARLFAERSHAAQTLQQSLLPPDLPEIPGVEVAARYRPAGRGQDVGGDFYDLFYTGGGEWAVVIGDVCGKGVDAAAITGLARYTIRAAAMRDPSPAGILTALNEAILRQRSDQRFCTVVYARLRRIEGRFRLTVCCGGHPPGLLARPDGQVEAVGAHGSLLGVFPDPDLSDAWVDLTPGDTVVFFTDGVTEARGPQGVLGQERLERALRSWAGLPPSEVADRIERMAIDYQEGDPRDDIALLVLQIRPEE